MFNIPSKIVPGDTVTWRDNCLRGNDPTTGKEIDYSPADYTLSWAIRGAIALDATATVDGNDYVTTLTDTQTLTLTKGSYFWQAFITNTGGDRLMVGSGTLEVLANLTNISGVYDGRSQSQIMLEAVETALKTGITKGIQSYTIKGRSLARYSIPELIQLRNQLKTEVAREKAADSINQGLGDPRRLFVRWM